MRVISFTLCVLISSSLFSQEKKMEIHFDPNLEFFGYLIDLGDPLERDPEHPITKVIRSQPQNENNALLAQIFALGADIDYSTLIYLMYSLPSFPLEDHYTVPDALAIKIGFHTEEERARLNSLILSTNNFYKQSNFNLIWNSLESHRSRVIEELRIRVPKPQLLEKMEAFYQTDYKDYEIVPSLTLWSAGFGLRGIKENTATFVLGPLEPNYIFSSDLFYPLSIHEFGHSFVNHIVIGYAEVIDASKSLFEPIEKSMIKQGYSTWLSCVIEHFVRAGEVILAEQDSDIVTSGRLMQKYTEDLQFTYLSFIVKQLKDYRYNQNLSYPESVEKTLKDLIKRI